MKVQICSTYQGSTSSGLFTTTCRAVLKNLHLWRSSKYSSICCFSRCDFSHTWTFLFIPKKYQGAILLLFLIKETQLKKTKTLWQNIIWQYYCYDVVQCPSTGDWFLLVEPFHWLMFVMSAPSCCLLNSKGLVFPSASSAMIPLFYTVKCITN